MKRVIFLFILILSSCAYRLGPGVRTIPGGYKTMAIPIFKNRSTEPGAEVFLTNAVIQEFQRSKVAQVLDPALAEVRLEGEIVSLENLPQSQQESGDSLPYLPKGTVLATDYKISLKVSLRLLRQSDDIEVWGGSFNGERRYSAAQVTVGGLNSVNPLYDLSARRQNIELLAKDIMAEAHNRITENF